MKIIKFKKQNNNLYTVLWDDDTTLKLYDDTIIKYNLLGKKEFTSKERDQIIKTNNGLEAYYKALKYLSYKLRTKKEVEKYLRQNKYGADIINEAIKRLENEKYLNDDIYLQAYINDQVNLSSKGPNLIKKELIKLGFKEDEIKAKLATIEKEIWQEKIDKIIQKKNNSNHNLSSKILINKIKTYLINQGYYLNDINEGLNKVDFADNNEILEKEFNKELSKLKKKYANEELNLKIKYNLYRKGFDMSKIDELLSKIDVN